MRVTIVCPACAAVGPTVLDAGPGSSCRATDCRWECRACGQAVRFDFVVEGGQLVSSETDPPGALRVSP